MLRNPVSLYLSQGYWPKRQEVAPLDFIAPDGELQTNINNQVVDHTSHNPIMRDIKHSFPPLRNETDHESLITPEHLLPHFDMVGITELFCESLFLTCTLTGLQKVPFWRRLTSSGGPKPQNLSDKMRGQIETITAGDQILYNQMREKLLDEHGPLIEFFQKELKTLEDSHAPSILE